MGMTLELSRLCEAYGQFDFAPVDLTVDDEVLAVLGPSGSGRRRYSRSSLASPTPIRFGIDSA
jgi:hypothetical protein